MNRKRGHGGWWGLALACFFLQGTSCVQKPFGGGTRDEVGHLLRVVDDTGRPPGELASVQDVTGGLGDPSAVAVASNGDVYVKIGRAHV